MRTSPISMIASPSVRRWWSRTKPKPRHSRTPATAPLLPWCRLRQRQDAMRAFQRHSLLSGLVAAGLAAITGAVAWPRPALAEIPAIVARQRAEKTTFTDAEIVEGFLKTAFGAEYHLAGRVDRIRKYDIPVRVFADGSRADRKAQLAKVVADIGERVAHLDIAMAAKSEDANVHVKLVRDRDLYRTIAGSYGRERAR